MDACPGHILVQKDIEIDKNNPTLYIYIAISP